MNRNIYLFMVLWMAVVGLAFYWNLIDEEKEREAIAFETARAFFNQIVLERTWNSEHGGVYVPVTINVKPNPYLEDPLRDLLTDQGMQLTKINPAYMTRQIAEIAAAQEGVKFHITSLRPVRPENGPTDWEAEWLRSFEQGVQEQGAFVDQEGKPLFRYMAPLATEESCLKCHAKHGYKKGDIRGGISVTLPFFPETSNLPLYAGYGTAGLVGLIVLLVSGMLLEQKKQYLLESNRSLRDEVDIRKKTEEEKEKLIESLQDAINEIKTLRGIIPICAHCKQIRDDEGSWKQIESYIRDHSDAQFSHGICPACFEKHYPGMNKQKKE